jgi:hypothetical protein
MSRSRVAVGLLAGAAIALCGCAAQVAGQATAAAVGTTGSSAPETTPCDDITYADPSIAFQPSLADGDILEVGETSWISGSFEAADVEVSGDPAAVELADRSTVTTIACGEAMGSASWLEVSAEEPGRAVLTFPDGDRIRITVR